MGATLVDPLHLYPYTHVQALLGLARIAYHDGDLLRCDQWLRRALRFAGRRSLLEEYVAVIQEIVALKVAAAPVPVLVESILKYVRAIELNSATRALNRAIERWLAW